MQVHLQEKSISQNAAKRKHCSLPQQPQVWQAFPCNKPQHDRAVEFVEVTLCTKKKPD